eukprot:GHVT01049868.1.p1 GENE.GHVT01049868.1~~GHVT01049868.1.p1  ORF type:complete len:761 (+),score=167.29 GHVT01049868.1:170-2452(+)
MGPCPLVRLVHRRCSQRYTATGGWLVYGAAAAAAAAPPTHPPTGSSYSTGAAVRHCTATRAHGGTPPPPRSPPHRLRPRFSPAFAHSFSSSSQCSSSSSFSPSSSSSSLSSCSPPSSSSSSSSCFPTSLWTNELASGSSPPASVNSAVRPLIGSSQRGSPVASAPPCRSGPSVLHTVPPAVQFATLPSHLDPAAVRAAVSAIVDDVYLSLRVSPTQSTSPPACEGTSPATSDGAAGRANESPCLHDIGSLSARRPSPPSRSRDAGEFWPSPSYLKSPWHGMRYPEPSSLWPNPLLHNLRLQPILLPVVPPTPLPLDAATPCVVSPPSRASAAAVKAREAHGDSAPSAVKPGDIDVPSKGTARKRSSGSRPLASLNSLPAESQSNVRRLTSLWRLSASHGVSWDTLDEVYVQWVTARDARRERWQREKAEVSRLLSRDVEASVKRDRREFLKRKGVDLEEMEAAAASRADRKNLELLLCPRSIFRKRMLTELRSTEREFMRGYAAGDLALHLRGCVTARMMLREAHERRLCGAGTAAEPLAPHTPEEEAVEENEVADAHTGKGSDDHQHGPQALTAAASKHTRLSATDALENAHAATSDNEYIPYSTYAMQSIRLAASGLTPLTCEDAAHADQAAADFVLPGVRIHKRQKEVWMLQVNSSKCRKIFFTPKRQALNHLKHRPNLAATRCGDADSSVAQEGAHASCPQSRLKRLVPLCLNTPPLHPTDQPRTEGTRPADSEEQTIDFYQCVPLPTAASYRVCV